MKDHEKITRPQAVRLWTDLLQNPHLGSVARFLGVGDFVYNHASASNAAAFLRSWANALERFDETNPTDKEKP